MGDLVHLPARSGTTAHSGGDMISVRRREAEAWRSPAEPTRFSIPRRPSCPPSGFSTARPIANPFPTVSRAGQERPISLIVDIGLGLAAFLLFCGLVGALAVGCVELWRATQP